MAPPLQTKKMHTTLAHEVMPMVDVCCIALLLMGAQDVIPAHPSFPLLAIRLDAARALWQERTFTIPMLRHGLHQGGELRRDKAVSPG